MRATGSRAQSFWKGSGCPWRVWRGWASPWPLGNRAVCGQTGIPTSPGQGEKVEGGNGAGSLSRSQSPHGISLGAPFPHSGEAPEGQLCQQRGDQKTHCTGQGVLNYLGAARCYPASPGLQPGPRGYRGYHHTPGQGPHEFRGSLLTVALSPR